MNRQSSTITDHQSIKTLLEHADDQQKNTLLFLNAQRVDLERRIMLLDMRAEISSLRHEINICRIARRLAQTHKERLQCCKSSSVAWANYWDARLRHLGLLDEFDAKYKLTPAQKANPSIQPSAMALDLAMPSIAGDPRKA